MQDPLSAAFAEPEEPHDDSSNEAEAPPPPYDSLILTNDEAPQQPAAPEHIAMPPTLANSSEASKPDGPKDFEIFVTDPVKQGDGVGGYVSYKVSSKTNLPQYKGPEHEVIRRFKDFDWLFHRLSTTNRGVIIPPVPEKNAVSKISATTDFIETRRRALQSFINKVAEHPKLKTSPVLQLFLEGSEIEWRTEVDRVTSHEKNPAQKLTGTFQFFKDLQHNATNIVSGKNDEEDEDPEYLKVKEYITLLEGHLTEAHRQATRVIKKQTKMADALSGFGGSTQALSGMEGGNVQRAFDLLGAKAQELAKMTTEQTDDLNASFEEPLKEFCKYIKSVKGVMADRSQALSLYHQLKQDAWNKRNKLTKLKGTPGIKEEKVAQAERDLNEATASSERAKQEYEEIVHCMSGELARFQSDRAAAMTEILRDFAVAQAKLASDTAKAWRQLIPELTLQAGEVEA